MPPYVFRVAAAAGIGMLLLALVGGFAIITGPGEQPQPVAAVKPIRVMVVGDSITQGRDGGDPWRCEFYRLAPRRTPVDMVGVRRDLYVSPGKFADHYPDPDCDRDHCAKWGLLVSEAALVIGGQVAQAQPDVMIVLMGVNDLNHKHPVATLEADFRAFVSNARAAKPDLDVVVGTVLPTNKVVDQTLIDDYNAWLVNQAATLGIRLVDTAKVIDPVNRLYDGVHPDSRGAHELALAFLTTLG